MSKEHDHLMELAAKSTQAYKKAKKERDDAMAEVKRLREAMEKWAHALEYNGHRRAAKGLRDDIRPAASA